MRERPRMLTNIWYSSILRELAFLRFRLTPKINIAFFTANSTLNIFVLNFFFFFFFGKSVFSEETAKNCSKETHLGEPECNKFWPLYT